MGFGVYRVQLSLGTLGVSRGDFAVALQGLRSAAEVRTAEHFVYQCAELLRVLGSLAAALWRGRLAADLYGAACSWEGMYGISAHDYLTPIFDRGITLVGNGRILLAHRHPQRRWYPGCWDLIGRAYRAGRVAGLFFDPGSRPPRVARPRQQPGPCCVVTPSAELPKPAGRQWGRVGVTNPAAATAPIRELTFSFR